MRLRDGLTEGRTPPLKLWAHLSRIDATNTKLNAIVHRFDETALKQAQSPMNAAGRKIHWGL